MKKWFISAIQVISWWENQSLFVMLMDNGRKGRLNAEVSILYKTCTFRSTIVVKYHLEHLSTWYITLFQIVLFSSGLLYKKGKRKVQGVPQSQTAALPRHQEEEETDKSYKTTAVDLYMCLPNFLLPLLEPMLQYFALLFFNITFFANSILIFVYYSCFSFIQCVSNA